MIPNDSNTTNPKRKQDDSSSSLMIQSNSSVVTFEKYWNLDAMNGIRCLASFSIVLLHVFHIRGALFLRESSCFTQVNNTPFGGKYLFRLSFQMSLFWVMSGFLCEYGLHKLYLRKLETTTDSSDTAKKCLTWFQFTEFVINRVVRIYPLYLLYVLMIFISSQLSHGDDDEFSSEDCTLSRLLLTLVMIMNVGKLPTCAGVAWSLQADTHGYLVVVALFGLTYQYSYSQSSFLVKKTILIAAYVSSLIYSYSSHPLPSQWNMSPESIRSLQQSWCGGFDTLPEFLVSGFGYGKSYNGLYPSFDFHTKTQNEVREFCVDRLPTTYFTTITKHAGSFFLGPLLYVVLYERYQKRNCGTVPKQCIVPILKLVSSIVLLEITEGAYWIQGIPMYLLLDAVFSMKVDVNRTNTKLNSIPFSKFSTKQIPVELCNCIVWFLSLPLFGRLAQLSFGIYLLHVPLYFLMKGLTDGRAANIIVPSMEDPSVVCHEMEANGFGFSLRTVVVDGLILFAQSSFVALLLHRFVERPCYQVRKVWLPKVVADFSKATEVKDDKCEVAMNEAEKGQRIKGQRIENECNENF
jgi:peptidoglycan/LPS O-acetylase OafA/YrhL